jgi:hypothetical protein
MNKIISKNRRGFLLANETLKIIIAVICIMFLVYFLTMLYFSKTGTQKRVEAESTLDRIDDIVKALKVGEKERQGILAPKGWNLMSFERHNSPNSCSNEDCLCICPRALDVRGKLDRQIKKCDADGVCLGIRGLEGNPLDAKILGEGSLVSLEISKSTSGILVRRVS